MHGVINDKLLINMKRLVILTTLLFTGALSGQVLATGLEEVALQDVSTTGKSLVIDRGILEKFEEGLFARFYLQKGPLNSPKVFLVAEGELVKSFPRKSYWILRKVFIPDAIKPESKVLILTSDKITRGRPLKIKNRHVVLSKSNGNEFEEYLDQNKDNTPSRFIKAGADYEASPDIFEKQEMRDMTPDADVLVTTYEQYQTKGGIYYSEEYGDETQQKFFIGNREVALGDIKKAEDKKLFDSVAENYEKKTNGMKYGVRAFYSEIEKLKELPEINKKGTQASTFDEEKYRRKEADKVSPAAVAKMNRDGDQWSSDMDDASLRRYFIKTGMEKETRRRELALNELDGHEIVIHYSNALTTHGNATDPNYQGRGYNLGISYDLHLSRTSSNLKNWSLQFMFEKGVTEYDTGTYNARSEETAYGGFVNYYFINNPLTLNSFIYLAGIGLKNGSASVYSPDLTKEYSYQVLTMPSLQVMTKYRFRTGDLNEDTVNIGASFNFGINLDIKKLSVIDRLDDDINSKISVADLKYSVGMSVFF